ncbi:hypothetical protein F4779DRAFT_617633 [Xylariaceae sp. FL0662B]|nr:hypothetical protein F4779DRAFT_617633 [Xylariaceae sp. FL0662B]
MPTELQSQEEFDVAIDKQYVRRGCKNLIDYAKEPWNHYKDPRWTYLSIRRQKREDFLCNISNDERELVMHELNRVEQTAKNFFSWDVKKDLTKKLGDQYLDWKQAVKKEFEMLKMEIIEDEKDPPRRDRYIRTLEQLKEQWTTDESEQDSRAEEQDGAQESNYVDPLHGLKAGVMYFQQDGARLEGYNLEIPGCIGKYPNQKFPVSDILTRIKDNPLTEVCPPDHFRYFHFPSNNMLWIEKAMARYYHERPGALDRPKTAKESKAGTEKLLAREFWRGQMHGTGGRRRPPIYEVLESYPNTSKGKQTSPVHARHMRPKCSVIPRASNVSSMPSGTQINGRKAAGHNIALFLPYLHWETSSRRAKMMSVINEANRLSKQPQKPPNRLHNIVLATMVQRVIGEKKKPIRKTPSRTCLARYLLTLARIAEELDFEADERLLRDNIQQNPPLHIRRTLDQYYFPTLDDTSERDKDQVVYRGTKPSRDPQAHNTRVVMVDQLWLWILDDNTIITSFPRRWGRNKPDPSGVHKSLRERLQNGAEDITSIYHLALIIIDQCSRVFFDRTKPLDQRPEVMDLFASDIGDVTDFTTIAHESFWRNVALVSDDLVPNDGGMVRNRRLLDINPEGRLLQEAQDITEELRIMRQIFQEQMQVVKDFKRYLESWGERSGGQGATQTGECFNGMDKHDHARDEAALENLLSLKQQQASIVEAKASLQRADESVKQGRAIMAFTVVTIFFLPLSFFATFFGMNNNDINGAMWMTLNQQIAWMFGLSTVVIAFTISMAFSGWVRAIARFILRVPYVFFSEYTGIHDWWVRTPLHSESLERRSTQMFEHVSRRREDRRRQIESQKKSTPLNFNVDEANRQKASKFRSSVWPRRLLRGKNYIKTSDGGESGNSADPAHFR